jgi:hypothetical protein
LKRSSVEPFQYRRIGGGMSSARRQSNFGKAAPTACTTGFCIAKQKTEFGGSNVFRHEYRHFVENFTKSLSGFVHYVFFRKNHNHGFAGVAAERTQNFLQ